MKLDDLAALIINRIATLAFGEASVLQSGHNALRLGKETSLLQFRAHGLGDCPALSMSGCHD